MLIGFVTRTSFAAGYVGNSLEALRSRRPAAQSLRAQLRDPLAGFLPRLELARTTGEFIVLACENRFRRLQIARNGVRSGPTTGGFAIILLDHPQPRGANDVDRSR